MPGNSTTDDCPICLDALGSNGAQQASGHPAGSDGAETDWHCFHPNCINTWIGQNPTCPVCFQNLPTGSWAPIDLV
jgi:hypothetical protein